LIIACRLESIPIAGSRVVVSLVAR
jgi:hypothetical protein